MRFPLGQDYPDGAALWLAFQAPWTSIVTDTYRARAGIRGRLTGLELCIVDALNAIVATRHHERKEPATEAA